VIAAVALAAILLDESVIGPSPWYLKLVEEYRLGDRQAAISEEAPPERLLHEINALARLVEAARRQPSGPHRHQLDGFSIPAAVLLHTDRAFHLFERYAPAGEAELELPPRLVALMDDAARQAFEPRWARATALELSHQAQWGLALKLLDPAVKRYPQDPLLLMARGATLEALSWRAEDVLAGASLVGAFGSRQARVKRAAEVAREENRDAERCYRQALALRPDLHHARVRLGRVLQLLNRPTESIAELQPVAAQATAARDVYLAHLFLGQAHEREGRLERAVAEYEQAGRALPDGQAAAVALSHVLHRLGRWPASVAVLRAGVDRAGRRLVVDPWWPYLAGQSEDPSLLLEELRAEVSR
jgi:tetratricopeptide (TPR) repeat protein